MRKALIPALLLLTGSTTELRADPLDLQDWYRQAVSAAQSLLRPRQPDREVIAAPQDLDRQMALVPPRDGSRMPVFAPPR